MDHTPQGQGRRHFHRGRRNPDRRTPDRRGPQAPPQEQSGRDNLDVEQLMRDIRSRIAQRHGIDLTSQQVQDLASHRLDSVLDVRSIRPELMNQFRRAAGVTEAPATQTPEAPYAFDETTLYGASGGVLGFIRKILNPLLRLLFDPDQVTRAFKAQAALNTELLGRDAARDRRQAEWNALHYEILQRLVSEVSRISLETQSLSMKIESLSAKVDFNERRVRTIEGTVHQTRPPARTPEISAPSVAPAAGETPVVDAPADGQSADAPRRRRRRRRGRRSGGTGEPGATTGAATTVQSEGGDLDEGDEDADMDAQDAAPEAAIEADGAGQEAAEPAPPPAMQDPRPEHHTAQVVEPAPPRDEPPPSDATSETDPDPTSR